MEKSHRVNHEKDRRGKPFVALMMDCASPIRSNENSRDANDLKHDIKSSFQGPIKSLDVILTLKDPRDGQSRQYLSPKSPPCKEKDENDSLSSSASIMTEKGRHVFEIQNMAHSTSPNYSSFFVGSQVVSNPSLQLISRVDPLFFILPYFSPPFHNSCMITNKPTGKEEDGCNKSSTRSGNESLHGSNRNGQGQGQYKWQPWNQICQSNQIPSILLEALLASSSQSDETLLDKSNSSTTTPRPPLQLKHLFQINDTLGPDMILYKFDPSKVMKWLTAKFHRIEARLQLVQPPNDNASNGDIDTGGGAFASSFVVSDRHVTATPSPPSSPTSSTNKKERVGGSGGGDSKPLSPDSNCVAALHILCEYLSPIWTKAFLNHCKANKMANVVHASGLDVNNCANKKIQGDPTKHPSCQTSTNENDSIPSRSRTVVTPPPLPQSKHQSLQSTLTEADKLLQYTMGGGGKQSQDSELGSSSSSGNGIHTLKRKLNASKSVGLKRLEKVNTKGMKSLTSFFGASKKGSTSKSTKKRNISRTS